MIWSNSLRRTVNTRHVWGHTFQITPEHLDAGKMRPLRFSYDVLGEECLERLEQLSARDVPKADIYALLLDNFSQDDKLQQLWNQVTTIPSWVDWDQIARGQDVFYRYAEAAIHGLTWLSLLGGLGAARVTEVLARTGGFSAKVVRRRLLETTQYILQITKSIESIQPGGAGHVSSIRVRLLHAAVRKRIMKLAKEKPSYYNVQEWGIPINDLDSIGTIVTFSATLIWMALPRQGIFLRQQEIEDYTALWRLAGWFLGAPTEYLSTPVKAKYLMESLLMYEYSPSLTSQILANNIIVALQGQPPTYASPNFLTASARWLNGNALADALDLGRPSFYYTVLVAGQCLFFSSTSYFYRSVPYLDRMKINAFKVGLYNLIVENKKIGLGGETTFQFQYVPDFRTTTTAKGECERAISGVKVKGVERRGLRTLLLAGIFSSLLLWLGVRLLRSLLESSELPLN